MMESLLRRRSLLIKASKYNYFTNNTSGRTSAAFNSSAGITYNATYRIKPSMSAAPIVKDQNYRLSFNLVASLASTTTGIDAYFCNMSFGGLKGYSLIEYRRTAAVINYNNSFDIVFKSGFDIPTGTNNYLSDIIEIIFGNCKGSIVFNDLRLELA